MGEVYRARDIRLNRNVALKVLPANLASDAAALARLQREAQLLASLNHPNIAAIYGVEEGVGVHALVLELVEGPTLADRLAGGALSPDEALQIALQIAAALEAAHEHGIVHRDLKPSNVKLRPDGTVKLLDFGIAKVFDPARSAGDAAAPTVTAPVDAIAGTAAYMSPEQARGSAVDKRADIWAFGCVLYEMLTGCRAFAASTGADTIAAVLTSEPNWTALPHACPPPVAVFLRRCLQKEPRQRLRDIGDMRLALNGSLDGAVVATTRAPSRGPSAAVWVASLVVAGVLAGGAAWRFAAPASAPLSFVLPAPEGSAFGQVTMQPEPAVSPNGRSVAYLARSGSPLEIWVETLGRRDARPLPGTETASFPFWSPDSAFLGFSARGRLKKIDVSGRAAPQDLCQCSSAGGGTWSRDGTIVFAGEAGLFRIGADGGNPVALTTMDESRGEYAHRFPVMLADGKRFVFLIRSTSEAHRGIYLSSLDNPSLRQRLVPDDSNAAVGAGPDGTPYLFFVRDLTLLAQALDTSSYTLVGQPIVVARPVIPGETGRFAPFAVGGGSLVYRTTASARNRLLWFDRRGLVAGRVSIPDGGYRDPALSPDGTRLAVSQLHPQTGYRDVWVVDLARGAMERVTADPVGASFPVWTPDGRRVVFASARAGPWNLYSASPAGGGGELPIYEATEPLLKYPTAVTEAGRLIVYQGSGDLWMVPIDGSRPPSLLLASGAQGRVSPDGRWLAYVAGGPTDRQVYITTFPTPTDRWRVSAHGGRDPHWRQDGRELFFLADDYILTAVRVDPRKPISPGAPEPLFRLSFDPDAPLFGSVYAPTTDGQRFLVNETVERNEMLLSVTLNWNPNAR